MEEDEQGRLIVPDEVVPTTSLYVQTYDRKYAEHKREEFKTMCLGEGIESFEVFLDVGVSGEIELQDRPAGKQLIEEINSGFVGQVFIYTLNDLGETMEIIANAQNLINAIGGNLIVSNQFFGGSSTDS